MIQSRIVKYYAKKDPNIAIKVIPGHFVSTHSHLNNYLDMTTMKTRQNEAERIAIAMKDYYNVMGLPVCRLGKILARFGVEPLRLAAEKERRA